MLETITIKNFGIIEHVTLDLAKGLNILTGETGAGKSILIDALRFCLGERFQSSHLRDGAALCTVEASFLLQSSFLHTLPPWEDFRSDDDTLVIQRSVTREGKNKIRINSLTASVAQLKELGDALIDFHGAHDHQQLLAETQHLRILDTLSDFNQLTHDYATAYNEYINIRAKIQKLSDLAHSRERDTDLLEHQTKELEQVPLTEEHCASIEQDKVKINNAEKLFSNVSQALAILENDDASLDLLLSKTFKPLNALTNIDDKAAPLLDQLTQLQDNASTLLSSLRDYALSLSFNPNFANTINDQSDAYQAIKRKYGPTIKEAQAFLASAKEKLSLLQNFEYTTTQLQAESKECENKLLKIGKAISLIRKKSALLLKKTIEKELLELGFKSITFETRFEPCTISPEGIDKAIFYISTNAGESLKPMAEIISSGEAARLMLAIKRALMKVDPIPVLIFDEIDAQIGGRLGAVIGRKLKEIAAHRQVILITHLPQIAAFADIHCKIIKSEIQGRIQTKVVPLDKKARIEEMAHMMSGDTMTQVSIKHAQDMLADARKAL